MRNLKKRKNLAIVVLCISLLLAVFPLYAGATSGESGNEETVAATIGETISGFVGEILQTEPTEEAAEPYADTVVEVRHPTVNGSIDMSIIEGFPSDGILEDGKTYILMTNIANCFPLYVPAGATVTIDLNGKMLEGRGVLPVVSVETTATQTDPTTGEVITAENPGTLTITNSHAGSRNTDPFASSSGNAISGYLENGLWVRGSKSGFANKYGQGAFIHNKGTGKGIMVTGNLIVEHVNIIGCLSGEKDVGAAICGTSTAQITLTNVGVQYCKTTRFYTYDKEDNITTTIGWGGVVHSEKKYNTSNVVPFLNATNCVFKNNTSVSKGGAVSGGNITLTNCTIEGNTAYAGGGVSAATALTVSGGSIASNTASYRGGGVYLEGTLTSASFSNLCVISGNKAIDETNGHGYGGGLYSANSATAITFNGITVSDNQAARGGGGLCCEGYSAKVEIINCSISGNRSTVSGNGAGVHIGGSVKALTVTGSTFSGNSTASGGNGAGLYCDDASDSTKTISISNTTFKENEAGYMGGGACINGDTINLVISDVSFISNKATVYGGGLCLTGVWPSITLNNCEFDSNKTVQISGGGLYVSIPSGYNLTTRPISLTNCTIKNNHAGLEAAGHGGGVYVANNTGELTISGGTITGNKASDCGGGTYTEEDTILKDGVVITNNQAGNNGGGVYSTQHTTLYSALIQENQSGVAEIRKGTGTVNGSGGGCYGCYIIVPASVTDASSVQILNNSANGNGGGIGATRYFQIDGACTIKENNATKSGGGIHRNDQGLAYESRINGNCLIENNTATLNGGGVYIGWDTLTVGDGVRIIENEAGNGGAIYIRANEYKDAGDPTGETAVGKLVMGKAILTGNEATSADTNNGKGGGIYCEGAGSVTITGAELTGNIATNYGGGLYCEASAIANITDGTWLTNEATASHGGGIYIGNGGSLTLQGTTIQGNTAGDNGGGIFCLSSTVSLTNAIVNANKANGAGGCGGGIFVGAGSNLTVTGGEVSSNETVSKGGGLYAGSSATITLENGVQVTGNTANTGGGLAMEGNGSGATLIVDSSSITENTARENGGGIRITKDGGSTGITNVTLTNADVSNNTSAGSGGGIFLSGNGTAVVRLTATGTTTVNGNTATVGNGGGIWCGANSTVNLTGTTLSQNKAKATVVTDTTIGRGGALYIGSGSTVTIYGATLSENEAFVQGGGIWLGINTTATVTDTSFTRNKILSAGASNPESDEQTSGGGIYSTGTKLTVDGSSHFDANSATYWGGGLFATGNVAVEIKGSTVLENNTTANNGGGAYCTGAITVTGNVQFRNNSAYSGGGIYAARVVITGTEDTPVVFSGNTASSCGGGVFATQTANFTYASFTGNTARQDAGGVFLYTAGTVSDCIISGNRAGRIGGGLYIKEDCTATISDTTISGNDAIEMGASHTLSSAGRGGGIAVYGTAEFTNVTVSDNRSLRYGGGVQVGRTGSVTWHSGNIINNEVIVGGAGGVHVDEGTFTMESGTISGNRCVEVGGGIHAYGGRITILGGQISDNTVTAGIGGGIHADFSATVEIISGSITGNQALDGYMPASVTVASDAPDAAVTLTYQNTLTPGEGGAIAVAGATVTIGVDGCSGSGTNHTTGTHTDKSHPVISGNRADTAAGGVLVKGASTVNVYCGSITGNTAANAGRGHNILVLDPADADPVLTVYNAVTLGEATNPGLVVMDGSVQAENASANITLNYYQDNLQGTAVDKTAQITEGEYFNLPDAHWFWAKADHTFMGWTFHGPAYTASPYARATGDYVSIGLPYAAADSTDGHTGDSAVHMYALWAPNESTITYYGCVIDGVFRAEPLVANTANPISYALTAGANDLVLTVPAKPGYTFTGWYVYQDEGQNANWGWEPAWSNGSPSGAMHFIAANEALPLGDSHFGNITLIPVYTENEVTYTFYTVAPSNGVTGFGSLSIAGAGVNSGHTVNIKVDSGVFQPVTATAAHRYIFAGWYSDAACTQLVTENAQLSVDKQADGIYSGGTFYAKFDYYLTDLTVRCNPGAGYFRDQQSFIYEIRDSSNNLVTVITMQSGQSVTVCDLRIGETYTVIEVQSWSWRFTGTDRLSLTLAVSGNALTFTPVQTRDYWLTNDVVSSLRRGA